MDRKDILSSPDYWTTRIQIELYNCAEQYMSRNGLNRSGLAKKLGVSRSYVTQLLSGDFDHRLSKLTELVTSFGYVPIIEFVPVEAYSRSESVKCRPVVFSKITDYFGRAEKIISTEPISTNDVFSGESNLKICA